MDESNDESASRAIMRSAGVPSTSASCPPSALLDTRGENCVGEPWVPLGVDGWLDAGLPTFDRECLGEDPGEPRQSLAPLRARRPDDRVYRPFHPRAERLHDRDGLIQRLHPRGVAHTRVVQPTRRPDTLGQQRRRRADQTRLRRTTHQFAKRGNDERRERRVHASRVRQARRGRDAHAE